ncbi:hypothetical protein PA25_32370 [Pseudoalteromonas sp. A25]|uniref:TlpA disulfide reductase family protein n=1 Tax=Pseudoalteromonas sp. A25 TaxID=116092 RepID=UPI0012608A83|nr:TlpA disulfide reductase family protein [Pseudoalteromonas sp. A25]BBN83252.1 hypothetical protein PA25_32370 [Pseudoalteromonas sp. A25]
MKSILNLSVLLLGLSHLPSYSTTLDTNNYVQTHTLQGGQVDTRGKVTYLKFWATWCRYCVEEMPTLEKISKAVSDDLNVLSINIGFNQSETLVKRFMTRNHYSVATAFDHTGKLTKQFNVIGTPTHILLDEEGRELYRTALMSDELKRKLSTYMPKDFTYE